ncbi:MAG: putative monovalent cation/H+ antiporter subunit A [Bacteroidota bacterium]|nr:putative monovalent cation/H+ antiporter subunit A [Bacteroidota bacterium]
MIALGAGYLSFSANVFFKNPIVAILQYEGNLMLYTVISGFLLALLTPILAKILKANLGYFLAILPAGIFFYFSTFLNTIVDGSTFRFNYTWLPAMGVNLDFYLDGLSLFFAMLISGFGALIFIYSGTYMKKYRHRDKFFLYLLLFMASMLGVVLSDNLIGFIVFWELTSFSSYLLIGFNNDNLTSRRSALHAMVITVFGGLCLMAGMILLGAAAGTYSISEMLSGGTDILSHKNYLLIFILFCLGAFTKSAQFPFHFWLPNAMAAPTPVSAYLHSSTMVKAGIYLLARFSPVLGNTPEWHYTLTAVGFITMLWGAIVAIMQNDLKKILAYTTISALGILVLMIGIGSPMAIQASMVFLLAHALYKGTLFLITGNIDKATGSRDVTYLRGLRKAMPLTMVATILGCLSMSGVMPFLGFIGKEMVYGAAFEAGWVPWALLIGTMVSGLIFVAICIDLAYNIFFGLRTSTLTETQEVPIGMVAAPLLLSSFGLVFGLMPEKMVQPLLGPAAMAIFPLAGEMELHLWHGFNVILMLSLVTLLLGFLLYRFRQPIRKFNADGRYFHQLDGAIIFENIMQRMILLFLIFINFLQNGRLRQYLAIILSFFLILATYTLIKNDISLDMTVAIDFYSFKIYEFVNIFIILLAMAMVFYTKSRLTALVTLGVVGYSIAVIFIIFSAPDVAMTQFLIETLTVVLFVLILHKLPLFKTYAPRNKKIPVLIISILFGAMMTYVLLLVTQEQLDSPLKEFFNTYSYTLGKGRNIVNVILVDFRALDTLGEITVLGIASLGIYSLLKLKINEEGHEK